MGSNNQYLVQFGLTLAYGRGFLKHAIHMTYDLLFHYDSSCVHRLQSYSQPNEKALSAEAREPGFCLATDGCVLKRVFRRIMCTTGSCF